MLKVALFVVGLFVAVCPALAQAVTLRDSLTSLLKTTPADTNRVSVLIELAFDYRHSKPDSTYLLAKQACDLSRQLNYPSGEARGLATMAAAYKFLGDYAKSLTLYNQARELNQKINDFDRVAVVINNTADLYIQQEEWQKGLAAMRECFAIYKTLQNPKISSKSVYLTNLAECYYQLKNLDSAASYLKQALPIAITKKESVVSAIYYLLGDVAFARGERRKAHDFYQSCLKNAFLEARYSDMYEGYYRLAKLSQATDQWAEALRYANLALTNAQRATFTRGVLKSSQLLTSLYEGRNDTEALRYYKIAIAAKDSLYSQDKVKRLLSIAFGEKEQRQQAEAAQLADKTNVRFMLLLIILAVVGSIAFLLFRNNRQKQKANRLLQDKNKKIETTVAQLKAAQVSLAARNTENELLLKEIHHRVKNNLDVVSSLLSLQSARISDPYIQEAMLSSQNRVHSMGILHQKLYKGQHLVSIEMKDYFGSLSDTILGSYNASDWATVELPMPTLDLDVDRATSVGLIVTELLTNALKYAFRPGTLGLIRLSLTACDSGTFQLTVSDNGIGKTPNMAPQGTGFGTQLVELLTRQLDGTLAQAVANGTTISIRFPKKVGN